MEASLTALRAQTYRDFETILVNSSRGDALAEIVSRFPEVRLLQSPGRLLPHAARNVGVERASGDVLTFTDPDCRAAPGWLEAIVGACDDGHHIVAGPVLSPSEHTAVQKAIHLSRYAASLGAVGGVAGPAYDLPSANATLTRAAWDALGPFDGRFWCGDALLSLSALRCGYDLWFEPRAVVEHVGTHRIGQYVAQAWWRGREQGWAWWSRGDRRRGSAFGRLVSHPARLPREVVRAGIHASRAGRAGEFLASLPLHVAAQVSWTLGETAASWSQVLGGRAGAPAAVEDAWTPSWRRVVVLGAGPAGLAVASCLAKRGITATVLEAGDAPGESWRRHYDCLRLHTTAASSSLPGMEFDARAPRYPTRLDVVGYLEEYARRNVPAVRTGHRVAACRRGRDGWTVYTNRGTYEASHVVVATGFNRVPTFPSWWTGGTRGEVFGVEVIHSVEYRRAESYAGRRVLVAGAGNSGADIAVDLHAAGAEVQLAMRGPVFWIPREVWGVDWQRAMAPLPGAAYLVRRRLGPALGQPLEAVAARSWHRVQQQHVGDLRARGVKLATAEQILRKWSDRLPPLTADTLATHVRDGDIPIRGAVTAIGRDGVTFDDGRRSKPDVVVLATGFRPGLEEILPDTAALLDSRGVPLADGAPAAAPGLYFCGYRPDFAQISRSATAIADAIAGVF